MKLRNSFPKSKEEATKFDVEFFDVATIFKIYESVDSFDRIKSVVGAVNIFLDYNGYEQINIPKFIEEECNYESQDKIVSLSKHGYIVALVLFIKKESNGRKRDNCNM